MGWKKEYRAKIVTAQEAVADIKSEQRVYFGAGCAVPHDLIDALVARAEELTNVEVIPPQTDLDVLIYYTYLEKDSTKVPKDIYISG